MAQILKSTPCNNFEAIENFNEKLARNFKRLWKDSISACFCSTPCKIDILLATFDSFWTLKDGKSTKCLKNQSIFCKVEF